MTPEALLLRQIQLALSPCGSRVWRNNVATGWVGDVERIASDTVFIRNARPLHAGLCNGSSDLIGFHPVRVTAEMIGRDVAVFLAIEGKTGRARTTTEQDTFLRAVEGAGGIAIVGREAGAVREAVVGWRAK